MKTLTFDTETSGVDTDNDRIISCFLRAKDGDEVLFEREWVIDAGIEIPEGASEVHGMTTEWVREHGRKDVAAAIEEIVHELSEYGHQGFLICGYNSAFDLAILEAEAKRYNKGVQALRVKDGMPKYRFVDPLVIDRHIDKYRKGSRKLVDVARHYGIVVEEDKAHAADYDVYLTEQLIPKVLNAAWKKLEKERVGLTPDEFLDKLQGWQKEWKAEWAKHLTQYFAKAGKTEEDGSPIIVSGAYPY